MNHPSRSGPPAPTTPGPLALLIAMLGSSMLLPAPASGVEIPWSGPQVAPQSPAARQAVPVRHDLAVGEYEWLTPEMVYISPGTFMMGSPPEEPWHDTDELLHEVTLTRGFYLGKYEVTQAEWVSVMGYNPSNFPGCDDCPVEEVSWIDATEYCNELSRLEGLDLAYEIDGDSVTWIPGSMGYRLPTEAEWEYAYRAGTSTAFYNGEITEGGCEVDPNLIQIGWYCGNSPDETQPVGQKMPNDWGLYDIAGNVGEWVWDWYDSFYPGGPVIDPIGPDSSVFESRVVRGGCWTFWSLNCRGADRRYLKPWNGTHHWGVRVARTAQ